MMYSRFNKLFLSALLLMLATTVGAKDKLPAVSHDGLHLQPDTTLRVVYLKPGVDLSEYSKIALLDCYVAFKKNYKRDHNRDEADMQQWVNDRDMAKIRKELAKEFNKMFTKVLSKEGGHEMVTEGGDGVLILRPAIINLDVTAPDIMTAGMSRNFSASAGQMTLYMELLDGKTGSIIARVIDPEAAGNNDMIKIRNSVTNRADADRVLRRWATILNDHLAKVKG
jgi:hypothetical protein